MNRRLPMDRAKEILRQKLLLGRSHRAVARSIGVGPGTVGDSLSRARQAGLSDWTSVVGLAEDELERRLYGPPHARFSNRPQPPLAQLDIALRQKGVTRALLHDRYLKQHPDGYRYTQFWELYRRWKRRQGPAMRPIHRAGEKLFVDYSRQRVPMRVNGTGEPQSVELFTAVLGASGYAFAEVTQARSMSHWLRGHEHAFEHFGGVTDTVIPGSPPPEGSPLWRREGDTLRTYHDLLAHYGSTSWQGWRRSVRVQLDESSHARSAASLELVQRWLTTQLRRRSYAELGELSTHVRQLVDELNARVIKRYGVSRRELFEKLDRPALRPLPAQRFGSTD